MDIDERLAWMRLVIAEQRRTLVELSAKRTAELAQARATLLWSRRLRELLREQRGQGRGDEQGGN